MSSSGCWDEDKGSSRPHRCVRRTMSGLLGVALTSMLFTLLLLETGMLLQPALARGIVLAVVVQALALVVQALALGSLLGLLWLALGCMLFLLLLLEKGILSQFLLVLALPLALVVPELALPVQTLGSWIMNFWRACMHGHGGRLVKWGPHEWVLDSGAWNHHTSNLELLLEGGDFQFQEMDNKDALSSGDDAAAPDVQGRGSVRTDCFDLPGVHYVVGDDTRNVVSVSQLAHDHGLITVFEPTSCHVKEKKTGKIVGKGRLRNGMYILDSLRIVGQYIAGDRGASSGAEHGDGGGGGRGHGGRGNNGEEGDSGMAEGRGGGGRSRDGRRGGTAASRNQEQGSSGSGASGGDINDEEIVKNEEEGSSENEIQEMDDENVNEDDNGKTHQEINGNGEEEKKRGGGDGSTFGESSSKARKHLSRLVLVLCLCISACISLLQYTSRRTGVTILLMDFCSLLGFSSPYILSLLPLLTALSLSMIIESLFRGRSTEGTTGDHCVQESPQEHNRRLFGLSRFDDVTTDPTGHGRRQLPAGAFPSSTNAARREEFLVDSGASFHATWNEWSLVSYPKDLKDHTEPPTDSFGGIIGSIAVTRSGYLSGDEIKLDGVLLAPESRMNLVSVGQLSIQYEVKVEMDDEGVIIKKKQDGVQIGGGRMLNNHQYVLEYFQPGGLFAHRDTPHFRIFGRRRPGRAHVNTVPCPARSTDEETGADTEETGAGRESRAVRMRRPNTLVTGPMWSH